MTKRRKRNKQKAQERNLPVPLQEDDEGTPETRRTREGRMYDREAGRIINDPLGFYLKQKTITKKQHYAGSRLHGDFAMSHQYVSVMVKLGTIRVEPNQNTSEHEIDNLHVAGERCRRALRHLGAIHGKLARLVCIEGNMVDAVKSQFGWAARYSGMDHLKEALDMLYDFYSEDDEQKQEYLNRKNSIDPPYALR